MLGCEATTAPPMRSGLSITRNTLGSRASHTTTRLRKHSASVGSIGTVRTLDEDRFAQRFSVRRTGSHYSQANLERLRALLKEGKVAKDVMESLPDLSGYIFTIPADILKALKSNAKAWRNFQRFSPPYIRIRVAFIDGVRNRPAEFKKRLSHFIRMTEQNKQFGFGGIDKHF